MSPRAGWGRAGAVLCLVAIFLPSFLLVIGVLPFWEVLRRRPQVQAALRGVNAAVVGLLLAALYDPVWTERHRRLPAISRWPSQPCCAGALEAAAVARGRRDGRRRRGMTAAGY